MILASLCHAQGRGHALPSVIFLPFHTGQVGGRGGDGPMVQVGGNVLDTGPVMLAPGEQPLVSSEDPRIPDKGNRLGKCSHRHG